MKRGMNPRRKERPRRKYANGKKMMTAIKDVSEGSLKGEMHNCDASQSISNHEPHETLETPSIKSINIFRKNSPRQRSRDTSLFRTNQNPECRACSCRNNPSFLTINKFRIRRNGDEKTLVSGGNYSLEEKISKELKHAGFFSSDSMEDTSSQRTINHV
ncbi:hypothetical protein KOW79_002089 [Hemibagrus wyckioides]|uniref:Uncharacterized protein n=1 Tax=Hemibagrus wyckioides TaxID=337641 RepID=A0A9D3SRA3_9TELE|nr:hypothetical protein KOW79_002089 [Hemibagrus wyckioides]